MASTRETIIAALVALVETASFTTILRPVERESMPGDVIVMIQPGLDTIRTVAGAVAAHEFEVDLVTDCTDMALADSALAAVLLILSANPTLNGRLTDGATLVNVDEIQQSANKIVYSRKATLKLRYETTLWSF